MANNVIDKTLLKFPELIQTLNDAVDLFDNSKYTKAYIINFIKKGINPIEVDEFTRIEIMKKLQSVVRQTSIRETLKSCIVSMINDYQWIKTENNKVDELLTDLINDENVLCASRDFILPLEVYELLKDKIGSFPVHNVSLTDYMNLVNCIFSGRDYTLFNASNPLHVLTREILNRGYVPPLCLTVRDFYSGREVPLLFCVSSSYYTSVNRDFNRAITDIKFIITETFDKEYIKEMALKYRM